MNRSSLLTSCLAVWMAVMAGCASRPTQTIRGTVPITLSSDQKAPIFNAKLFELITITLPPPSRPGYSWQIGSHDAKLLQQKTDFRSSTSADSGPTITFHAVAPGRARVRFLLLPDTAARVVDPLEQLTATIVIE